jgi:DNA-directed RNA polymerase specialized sigma24 family protein
VNGCVDALRRARLVTTAVSGDVPEGEAIDPDRAAVDLSGLIDALPVVQRAVIALRYYDDLPLSEIAVVLERPLNTVKSDLRRALAALAKVVAP